MSLDGSKGSHSRDEDLEQRLISGWVDYLTPNAIPIIESLATLQASFIVEALRGIRPSSPTSHAAYPDYVALLEAMHRSSHCQLETPTLIESSIIESSIIVISPHLGFSKLMGIPFVDKLTSYCIDIGGIPHNEPWIWRHLAAWSIARCSNAALVPIEMRYGPPFDELQQAYGAISLDLRRHSLLEDMLERMDAERKRGSPIIFSIFPEAGTSGKRQGAGRPFRLEAFHRGFVISARRLGIPVVPIAHVVDPTGRSHLRALEPLWVKETSNTLDCCELMRKTLQSEMRSMLALWVAEPDAYL